MLEAFAILDADRAGVIPGQLHFLPPPSTSFHPFTTLSFTLPYSGKDVVVALRALGNEPSPTEIK